MWNLQPDGGVTGLGISPSSFSAFPRTSGSRDGIADSNAFVYGWLGFEKSDRVGADSTRVPRYITATVSQMWATTLRSWLMKRKVFISSPRNDSSRLRMSACIETSSAATLSSATTNLGLQTKARAMEIL